MDELHGPSHGHGLQGPHRDLRLAETTASQLPEVAPLTLILDPSGVRIEIKRAEAVIGRHSEADVRLAFLEVSRRHCRLHYAEGCWRVTDLQSTNGIFVNGQRLHEATLYPGDRLQIGTFQFLVSYELAAPRHEVLERIAEAIDEQRWAS